MNALDSLRRWWWDRGYQRYYARTPASSYAMNAGSEEAFAALVQELRDIIKPGPDDMVLDIGGGDGRLATGVFRGCRRLVVLDRWQPSELACDHFVRGDMHQPPFADRSFTIVFSYSTFATLGASGVVPSLLRRWTMLLRAGGVMFVGDIPDRAKLLASLRRGLRKESLAAMFKYYVAMAMLAFFSRVRLQRALERLGFEATAIEQSPRRRFHRERFDITARQAGWLI